MKVIPLTVKSCSCGWMIPVNLAVFGLLNPPIQVMFDCPKCGKSYEQHVVKG